MHLNILILSRILVVLFFSTILKANADNLQPSDITDLILVTGQSNVTGSQTEFDPILDSVDPRIFAFTSNNDWEVADLHQAWDVDGWHPGNGSIQDPSRTPYNSFAFHFAKKLVQSNPDRVIGLIIAGAPGKGISHWDNSSNFSQTIDVKALAALNAQGVKSTIDGILWHQGETDWQFNGTSDPNATVAEKSHATYYPEKLNALLTNFRNKSWFVPGKPFICGETKQAPVNDRLMALNDDSDPWTGCVVGNDLTTREMNLLAEPPVLGTHFDAASLRVLGGRYADMYTDMVGALDIEERTFVPTNDRQSPANSFTSPAADDILVPGTHTISGTATDAGGSGFSDVRIALHSISQAKWYNFSNNSFSGTVGNGAISATRKATSVSFINWSQNVTLPTGDYFIAVSSYDLAGNASGWNTQNFSVQIKDIQSPINSFTSPATNEVFSLGPLTISGTTLDTGDSGFNDVRIALHSISQRKWYNFSNNSFSGTIGSGAISATRTATSVSSTSWSQNVTLPAGDYFIAVSSYDRAGNASGWNTQNFSVEINDIQSPTNAFTSPVTNEVLPPGPLIFSGTAHDTGGSGFNDVRIALHSISQGKWYNFSNNSFSGTVGSGAISATRTATSVSSINWRQIVTLPAGDYFIAVSSYDRAGNSSGWNAQPFSVQ